MFMPSIILSLLCFLVSFALGSKSHSSGFTAVTPPQLRYQSGALICSLSDYGLTEGGDFASAVHSAFLDCVRGTRRSSTSQQAVLVVPAGNYYLTSNILLANGVNWFLHLNGAQILYQGVGGYAFVIQNANNFVLSGDVNGGLNATLRGSLNGQADLYAPFGSNIRLLKLLGGSNLVVGRFNFLQSPAYSLVVGGVTGIEIFQVLVNGQASHGETDAMDIAGENIHVHDCQIHGGDECVTMKSATNVLVENIYCEGASSEFGSFGEAKTAAKAGSASISNVVYRNIYSAGGAGFYIKACTTDNGLIRNVTISNLIVRDAPYPVGINFYWMCANFPEGTNGGGNLIVEDFWIENVSGTILDGKKRPVIKIECGQSSAGNFPTCKNINIANVNVWPATAGATSVFEQCSNAVGTGSCLSQNSFSNSTVYRQYTVKNQGAVPPPTWGLIQYPLHYYPEATYPPTVASSAADTVGSDTSSAQSWSAGSPLANLVMPLVVLAATLYLALRV